MTQPEFILASASSSRRTMLAAAGVAFTAVVPAINEEEVRGKMRPETAGEGRAVAEYLAESKALSVSAGHPKALVLGCDQVLVCEGRLFNKALDEAGAGAALRALRGRTHELISSAVIAKDNELAWRCTDVARLKMREFSDAFLEEYLQAELPDILGSVGCYRIEGLGAQLFERVEGDQFTIRGLPLTPLLAELRARGSVAVMSVESKLAAVIGWPVHQSVSPVLHAHWLKEHGIKGAYVPLPIEPAHFGRCVAALPLMGFAGASVTVPHKEAAFALASSLDEDASATGAVNTLVFEGEKIAGLNTDVRGFAASLAETLGADAARKGPAAVLGAGGAARAIVLALQRAGSPEIRVINRTPARSDALARSASGAIRTMAWGDWKAGLVDVGLLVNATSLGMTGKPALEIALDHLPRQAAVADIVYNPLETDLLRGAKARGHRTMDGLGMLMHQAVPAFAAWFGITPKVTPQLRVELERAIGG